MKFYQSRLKKQPNTQEKKIATTKFKQNEIKLQYQHNNNIAKAKIHQNVKRSTYRSQANKK